MNLDTLTITGWEAVLLALSCVLFWAAIIGIVRAVLHDPTPCHAAGTRTPEEYRLFRRFADGEIDDDEYRHDREALRGEGKPAGR